MLGPHEFRGFGHEFEKASTVNKISGSTGHFRIISYRFSDLNFIVRHETDGYVNAGTRQPSSSSRTQEKIDLPSMLNFLSLSSASSVQDVTPAGSRLTIKQEGHVVPIESTLEIKTRVSHKPLMMAEVVPQLWVSQTPKLVRAYHQKGTFQASEVEDVAAQIQKWEESNQDDLKKLGALISKIIRVVKGCGGSAVVKYDAQRDELLVLKGTSGKMLPKDVYLKWDDDEGISVGTGVKSIVRSVDRVEIEVGGKAKG